MLVGIDWGGTKIEAVAMTDAGDERVRIRERTPRGDYEGCIAVIAALIERLEVDVGVIERVGIGIPGSLEPRSRLGKGASSTWLLGQPVERHLQDALGRELRVENDADCLAASEARDGAGVGFNVVFAVILGSGAGAGVGTCGRAHHGPNNSAGEWGHNPLPFPAPDEVPGESCFCGKRGCLETWVSGRALEAQYKQAAGEDASAAEIAARARSSDRVAQGVLDRYIDRVARGLSVVVNTLDPDVIVMGGGMSNVDEIRVALPAAIASYTFSSVFETPIRAAAHGDSSGVRGAAWLWAETP